MFHPKYFFNQHFLSPIFCCQWSFSRPILDIILSSCVDVYVLFAIWHQCDFKIRSIYAMILTKCLLQFEFRILTGWYPFKEKSWNVSPKWHGHREVCIIQVSSSRSHKAQYGGCFNTNVTIKYRSDNIRKCEATCNSSIMQDVMTKNINCKRAWPEQTLILVYTW